MDELYPPKSKTPKWIQQMHKISGGLGGVFVDMKEKDWENAEKQAQKFVDAYRKAEDMVPEWKDYFDNGQPWVELAYYDTTGYSIIINSWDRDGNLTLENGNGLYIDYYNNGDKYSQGFFREGRPNGSWIYFNENQTILKEEFYVDGDLVQR